MWMGTLEQEEVACDVNSLEKQPSVASPSTHQTDLNASFRAIYFKRKAKKRWSQKEFHDMRLLIASSISQSKGTWATFMFGALLKVACLSNSWSKKTQVYELICRFNDKVMHGQLGFPFWWDLLCAVECAGGDGAGSTSRSPQHVHRPGNERQIRGREEPRRHRPQGV